jgi:soluble lytic murein transglycosylase
LKRFALFFLVVCAALCAEKAPFSFEELREKPPSRAKDFASLLFLRYGKGEPQKDRAVFYSLRSAKPPHLNAFAARNKEAEKLVQCRNADSPPNLSAPCLAIALSAAKAESLSNADRLKIAEKVAEIDPLKAAIFKAMANANPYEAAANDADIFYPIALGVSGVFLRKHGDDTLTNEAIAKLQNDARFSLFLERAAALDKNATLLVALANADESKTDFKGAFYLGIIRVLRGDLEGALKAFEKAETKAAARYEKDRAIFWSYLTSKKDTYLFRLYSSEEINFYSVYTRLKNNRPLPTIVTEYPAAKDMNATYGDETLFDPFFWNDLLGKIANRDEKSLKEELSKLGHKNAEPYRAAIGFALAPQNKPPIYYLNPYPETLKDLSVDERAMTLAIMRQESRYIPAALSTSFAIGSMQMMPFLIESMTKENKDVNDQWNFFKPERQAPYAIKHIRWLRNKLDNPLFIAYAYNGGLGFTKRTIEANKLFIKGEFEPFLSMERMPLEEPREYGKSVLTNYLIYRRAFGAPISAEAVFETK